MARKTQITLRESSTSGGSTATDTGSAQSVGKSLKSGKDYRQLTAFLDVTNAGADSGDKLDVYVDVSPDGGTTWANAIHFTQVLGNGGAIKMIATINGSSAAAVVNVTSDQSSGVAVDVGFFDTIRYRGAITDTGSNSTFTYSLHAFVK